MNKSITVSHNGNAKRNIKFGVLSYRRKKLSLNGMDHYNLGDWFQSFAIMNLYKEWGIDDYIFVNRDDASEYDGEKVILPMNCYHSFSNRKDYSNITFPLAKNIIPCFFSIRIQDNIIPEEHLGCFEEYSLIGCRDEETYTKLSESGIDAFVSGCVTLTLPKRKSSESQNKIILVDAPEEIEDFMPDYLKNTYDIEKKSQLLYLGRSEGDFWTTEQEGEKAYNEARKMMEYYKDNAKLIITSRLHVASPCIAMGIPVILVREDDFSERYSWIDRYIPLYNKKQFGEIDWNPKSIDCEKEKSLIKSVLYDMLMSAATNEKIHNRDDLCQVHQMYMTRDRYIYDILVREKIKRIQIDKMLDEKQTERIHFSIWGMTDHAQSIRKNVENVYPEMIFLDAIDSIIEGVFDGKKIIKPESMNKETDIIFILALTGAKDIKKYIDNMNKDIKWVVVDYLLDEWESNLDKK